MVAVGTHFTFLLMVVEWLKSKSTQLLTFRICFCSPSNVHVKQPAACHRLAFMAFAMRQAWHFESFQPSGEELDIGNAMGWEAEPMSRQPASEGAREGFSGRREGIGVLRLVETEIDGTGFAWFYSFTRAFDFSTRTPMHEGLLAGAIGNELE